MVPEGSDGEVRDALVAAVGVGKHYGSVPVLSGVDFAVRAGEVHALLGENGAGKSTLLKILSGLVPPTEGEVRVAGAAVRFASPHDARAAGIATVYQETSLFPDLSVAENVFLGNAPAGRRGVLDWRAMRRGAADLLARLEGHDVDVDVPVGHLSVAHKQQVEIARALALKAKVIILDEPTTALTDAEVDKLLAIVRQLRAAGVGIVYVSHRLGEIFEIADRITVLRDGRRISTDPIAAVDHDGLVRNMVGRPLEAIFPALPQPSDDVRLSVAGLDAPGRLHGIDLSVRRGEILGVAGLVGSGRTSLAQALFGVHPAPAGSVEIDGVPAAIARPADAIAYGLAYVPEDRGRHGLVLPESVGDNIVMPILSRLSRGVLRDRRAEDGAAENFAARFGVRTRGIRQRVGDLSGGNQQKTVLAKWMATEPKVLILDEPTRGVDIGAKAEIYKLIAAAVADGVSVLLISSELPEILGLSHTVVVMSEGRIVARIPGDEATPERVGAAMTGASTLDAAA